MQRCSSRCGQRAVALPPATTWSQKFVTHDGIRIEYRVRAGRGVPVVFVPGMGVPALDYQDNHELAAVLGARPIIAISIRGRGASDSPETGWTVGDQASDIAAVTEVEQLTRYHLVGHSMGVGYALHHALAHPDGIVSFTAADYRPGLVLVSEEWVANVTNANDGRYDRRIKRRMLREQGTADYVPDLAMLTIPTLAILGTRSSDRFVEAMWRRAPDARVLWIEHGHDTFASPAGRGALADHVRHAESRLVTP
ncbi:MAG: alpha/beta hydrolase [Kofleriaceae bacterium]